MDLQGRKGLIVGVANDASIASGCATAFERAGARLALTYLNDKAKPHVAAVASDLRAEALLKLDVTQEAEIEAVFAWVREHWGELDFLLHSIAFAPRPALQQGLSECTAADFAVAMDVSCHSLIRLTKAALPLMREGGCVLTVSYYGAEKVVESYNVMGPVKAALEACVRYLAVDLGHRRIRVNALSPGPIRTRAASGLSKFDELLTEAVERVPERRLVTIEEVGELAAFLMSPRASGITGGVHYVDGGYNITA